MQSDSAGRVLTWPAETPVLRGTGDCSQGTRNTGSRPPLRYPCKWCSRRQAVASMIARSSARCLPQAVHTQRQGKLCISCYSLNRTTWTVKCSTASCFYILRSRMQIVKVNFNAIVNTSWCVIALRYCKTCSLYVKL